MEYLEGKVETLLYDLTSHNPLIFRQSSSNAKSGRGLHGKSAIFTMKMTKEEGRA